MDVRGVAAIDAANIAAAEAYRTRLSIFVINSSWENGTRRIAETHRRAVTLTGSEARSATSIKST